MNDVHICIFLVLNYYHSPLDYLVEMGLNPKKYCIDKSIKYFSTLGCRIRIPPIDLQFAIQQNIIFKKYFKNVKSFKENL